MNKTSNLKYLISKTAARLSTKYSSMEICEIEKTAPRVVGSSFLVVTEHWQSEQLPRPRVRQSWPSWSFLRQPSASTVFNRSNSIKLPRPLCFFPTPNDPSNHNEIVRSFTHSVGASSVSRLSSVNSVVDPACRLIEFW